MNLRRGRGCAARDARVGRGCDTRSTRWRHAFDAATTRTTQAAAKFADAFDLEPRGLSGEHKMLGRRDPVQRLCRKGSRAPFLQDVARSRGAATILSDEFCVDGSPWVVNQFFDAAPDVQLDEFYCLEKALRKSHEKNETKLECAFEGGEYAQTLGLRALTEFWRLERPKFASAAAPGSLVLCSVLREDDARSPTVQDVSMTVCDRGVAASIPPTASPRPPSDGRAHTASRARGRSRRLVCDPQVLLVVRRAPLPAAHPGDLPRRARLRRAARGFPPRFTDATRHIRLAAVRPRAPASERVARPPRGKWGGGRVPFGVYPARGTSLTGPRTGRTRSSTACRSPRCSRRGGVRSGTTL